MIRETTCEIESGFVHIQIGDEQHRFILDEADKLYALLADSSFESDEEVDLKGIRMTGEEACRLLEVMEEAAEEVYHSSL